MQQREVRTRQRGYITEKCGSHLRATDSHASNEMSDVENLERGDMAEIQSQLDGTVALYCPPLMRSEV